MGYHFKPIAASIITLFLVGLAACGDVPPGEEFPVLNSSISALSNRQPHVEAEVEQLVRKLFQANADKDLEGMAAILWQD